MTPSAEDKRPGYVQIPTELLRDNRLSLDARGAFCGMLARMAERSSMTEQEVAQLSGEAADVAQLLLELDTLGYVTCVQPATGDTGASYRISPAYVVPAAQ